MVDSRPHPLWTAGVGGARGSVSVRAGKTVTDYETIIIMSKIAHTHCLCVFVPAADAFSFLAQGCLELVVGGLSMTLQQVATVCGTHH